MNWFRFPQIIENFRRSSTEGVSPLMFLAALLGNLTYTLSILIFSTKRDWLLLQIPWLIGSAGVLLLDAFILLQYLIYDVFWSSRNNYKEEHDSNINTYQNKPLLQEDDERSDNEL